MKSRTDGSNFVSRRTTKNSQGRTLKSVVSVRTSAHDRARGLGLSGHRPCRMCGNQIGFAVRDGRWKPVEARGALQSDGSTLRPAHRCQPTT